jgi:hypothetical protein
MGDNSKLKVATRGRGAVAEGAPADRNVQFRADAPQRPFEDSLSIAYLGPTKNSEQCENFVTLMRFAGKRVCVFESSVYGSSYDPPRRLSREPLASLWRKGTRVYSQRFGTTSKSYLDRLGGFLEEEGVNCIVAFWGTGPLADIIAIKKARPEIRILLNLLCHPLGLSPMAIAAQNYLLRNCSSYCDGLIVSSTAMCSYVRDKILGQRSVPILIWPPYLSQRFFPIQKDVSSQESPHAPNVLFLGRVDWDNPTAQTSDNVASALQRLADLKVHVYHARVDSAAIPDQEYAHSFDYLPLKDLGPYATQFDASLVMYNLNQCKRPERFQVTVPDRLVASVAAGLPVALPSRGYDACREYLQEYGALISFESCDDLSLQLKDRSRLASLRRLAQERSQLYRGEEHIATLIDFLERGWTRKQLD